MSVCTICDGVGLVRLRDTAGNWVSRPCECQETERERVRLAAAQIPARYRDCTLDTSTLVSGVRRHAGSSVAEGTQFAEAYPVDTAGRGCFLWAPRD